MKFYDQHQDQRDRFEVLSIHDPNGKSYSQVEKILQKIEKRQWRGRALPFPILFDSTATTIVGWGVQYWPTQFLVDPDGYIVANGDECERALAGALAKERVVQK